MNFFPRFRQFWRAKHLTVLVSTTFGILGFVFGFFGFQARYDQRQRELAALIANQNLAWVSQRYVEFSLAKAPLEVPSHELTVIRKAVESIDLREVVPPQLIVDFVWLWSAAQGLDGFAKTPPPTLLAITRDSMRRINACLEETGWASIDENGFAIALNTSWFGTRFSFWHHIQPEFCPKTTASAPSR